MDQQNYILYCKLDEILKRHDNMSVLKLSEEIGHRRTTIMELLHNTNMEKKKISASLITKLCVYFDVTPNDLFEIRKRVE
ncbi:MULTISPECIES: helix-turn-helix domain-containing protein [Paenibacillus]|uniref:helix-turn-helix domain-containing protein n=1 Tax=Paenibacillus TaxID=44249 RepID=UPI000F9E6C19|nr:MULTISPECIES: helix-turn-helix transcriptional regulator [Paenibacillus]MCP3747568.1 helix-turn-helix transcriptional regulator [Paenibacillus sp. A3M_27_13]MDY8025408.1 helix-turn-helix transcriptional regulator [Paenibacillus polymyxa]